MNGVKRRLTVDHLMDSQGLCGTTIEERLVLIISYFSLEVKVNVAWISHVRKTASADRTMNCWIRIFG